MANIYMEYLTESEREDLILEKETELLVLDSENMILSYESVMYESKEDITKMREKIKNLIDKIRNVLIPKFIKKIDSFLDKHKDIVNIPKSLYISIKNVKEKIPKIINDLKNVPNGTVKDNEYNQYKNKKKNNDNEYVKVSKHELEECKNILNDVDSVVSKIDVESESYYEAMIERDESYYKKKVYKALIIYLRILIILSLILLL